MEADASSVASRMNALLQREQQVTQQLKACSAYVTAHSLADCEPFPVDEHGALQCQDMGAIAELHAKIDRFCQYARLVFERYADSSLRSHMEQ